MPIEVRSEADGMLFVRATGTLGKQDYATFVPAFERAVAGRAGKLRVLFDMTALQGWDPAAMWQEIKFDFQHMSEIERLAVVGNREWQHLLTSIGNAFPHVQARYFEQPQAEQARAWLLQP